jgi:hypothetical protein
MKVIDTPRTNKIANTVAYVSPFGQCYRAYVIPRNPRTEAQMYMRQNFGSASRGWGRKLTEPQRQRWVQAALTAPSHPSLGQYSHLSGQQLQVKINSTLCCIGQPPVDEPPAPVVFGPNPVGDLLIVNDEAGGVRLLLNVGPATEDIMLFGQAPCNSGRTKHRRVNYLCLLGPAANGQCDITAPYVARFGQPRPGQKVFVVTCQHKNGWKAQDHVTSAIVPPTSPQTEASEPRPAEAGSVTSAVTPDASPAVAQPSSQLPSNVYKGSTPDAPGVHSLETLVHPLSFLCTPLVHIAKLAFTRLATPGMAGAGKPEGQPCH